MTSIDGFGRMFMFEEAVEILSDYERSNPPCSMMNGKLIEAQNEQRSFSFLCSETSISK